MEKEITIDIKRPTVIFLLILLVAILIQELLITFPSPIVFGDEGFHTQMSKYMSEEKEYPVWVPFEGNTKLMKVGFKRPPLWELTEGGFYLVFGFNEFIIKFLTPFIAVVLTGLGTFILVKRVYNEKIGFLTSLILVTIPSFVTYSVLFYTDAMLVFYLSLFMLTFFLSIKTDNKKYLILSGIFAALAFLTKTPAFMIFPLIGLGFLYQIYKQKNIMNVLKNYLGLLLVLFLILGPFVLRNYVYYHTPTCDLPIFDSKDCSVTFEYKNKKDLSGELEQTGTSVSILRMGLINYLTFAYGNGILLGVIPLGWFVIFGVLGGLIIIGLRKKDEHILIIFAILSFLPIIYLGSAGRAEDTARYTLGLVPILALISGIYFDEIYDAVKKYKNKLAVVIIVIVIVLTFINLREKLIVMRQVKQFSPSFFEACDFVKKNTTEDAMLLTIWIHHSAYNCQRDIAGFSNLPDIGDIVFSEDLNLTLSRLKAHGITHIFIQKFSISMDNVAEKYPLSFINFLEKNPDNFVKIYENGPSLQQCLQAGGCDGNILYEINYKNVKKEV
jgi:4-amino-4-deoxy-L-arabinose transferase-like glycosyltransferase